MPSTTITLEAAADAWVDSSSTNHGSDSTLRVERYTPARTYVRFDLASIPAGAEIVEAELTMTAFDGYAYGSGGNVYVHRVADDTWGEGTIHGMNAPAIDATPLGYWWLWYDDTDRDQIGRLTGALLRDAVADEASGDDALSVRLHSPGYDTRYRSREYATAGQRPTLRIRYVLP